MQWKPREPVLIQGVHLTAAMMQRIDYSFICNTTQMVYPAKGLSNSLRNTVASSFARSFKLTDLPLLTPDHSTLETKWPKQNFTKHRVERQTSFWGSTRLDCILPSSPENSSVPFRRLWRLPGTEEFFSWFHENFCQNFRQMFSKNDVFLLTPKFQFSVFCTVRGYIKLLRTQFWKLSMCTSPESDVLSFCLCLNLLVFASLRKHEIAAETRVDAPREFSHCLQCLEDETMKQTCGVVCRIKAVV